MNNDSRVEGLKWFIGFVKTYGPFDHERLRFLMPHETGCPEIYIPSLETISLDVRLIYACTCERLAQILQQHKGKLSFLTDRWTLPNHWPFVALFMVHLEHKGSLLTLPLQIIEPTQVS